MSVSICCMPGTGHRASSSAPSCIRREPYQTACCKDGGRINLGHDVLLKYVEERHSRVREPVETCRQRRWSITSSLVEREDVQERLQLPFDEMDEHHCVHASVSRTHEFVGGVRDGS